MEFGHFRTYTKRHRCRCGHGDSGVRRCAGSDANSVAANYEAEELSQSLYLASTSHPSSSSERPRPAPSGRGWVAPRDSRHPSRPGPAPVPNLRSTQYSSVVEYPSVAKFPPRARIWVWPGPRFQRPHMPFGREEPMGAGVDPASTDFQITLRFDLLQKTDPSTWRVASQVARRGPSTGQWWRRRAT